MAKRSQILTGAALAAASALTLGACADLGMAEPAPAVQDEVGAQQGHAIAQAECARCHAVERTGDSPLAGAPPLRTVLARYDAATLEADLIEGMRVGHADMPRFSFDPLSAGALIAYLESIQE